MDLEWRSPDDSLKGTVSDKVMQTFLGACRQGGRDPCPGPSLEGWVTSAGFEDVHVRKMIAPMGTWTSDKNLVSATLRIDGSSHCPFGEGSR
jgi:hypothetical protein